ncbi:hypothetical protein [Flavobacterium sp.]|uniref:hypothetical protein n=1 Tax=Flavobacterium sp. TaxID=239 RepID=UPI003B9DB856
MRLLFHLKASALFLFLLSSSNLFGQVFLEEKFDIVEMYHAMQNQQFEKEKLPNGDMLLTHFVFDENKQVQAFKEILFSKNNTVDYTCFKESAYVRYNEKIANDLILDFNAQGYESTNFISKDGNQIFKSSDKETDSKKHYLCMSTVEIESQGKWILFEYFSKETEFVEK